MIRRIFLAAILLVWLEVGTVGLKVHLNYGAIIEMDGTGEYSYEMKFTATLPLNSYAGIGFGTSMTDVNMLIFTTGS